MKGYFWSSSRAVGEHEKKGWEALEEDKVHSPLYTSRRLSMCPTARPPVKWEADYLSQQISPRRPYGWARKVKAVTVKLTVVNKEGDVTARGPPM